MPTFLTLLRDRASSGEVIENGRRVTRFEGDRTWRHFVLAWGGVRVVLDQDGQAHGGPGLSFAATVDDETAAMVRISQPFLAGHVWEKGQTPAEQLRERATAEQAQRHQEQEAEEARLRRIVREELVRAGLV